MDFLTILPNLSIGVVAIVGLVYVVLKFLDHLDKRTARHEMAMTERENAFRTVEKEVRENLTKHISESTFALQENTKVLSEVVRHLENTK